MTAMIAPTAQSKLRDRLASAWRRVTLPGPTNIRLGIWGTGGAGKTTFLSMLYDQLLISPRWTVAADDEASAFVEQHLATIFGAGEFPAPTEAEDHLELLSYHMSAKDQQPGAGSPVSLTFVDAPGEFYENPARPDSRVNDEMDIVDYLCSCHGLIFLIDPQRLTSRPGLDYQLMLLNLFSIFQRRAQPPGSGRARPLEQHMAFCITKVDREPLWGRREAPEDLAREVLGRRVMQMIEMNYGQAGRYRYFATSAIGRYQDRGGQAWVENVRPAGARARLARESESLWVAQPPAAPDGWLPPAPAVERPAAPAEMIVSRDEIAPLNVIEPLEWLLNEIPGRMPQLNIR